MLTDLLIKIGAAPPHSCGNCMQELQSIPNGYFKRSVSGKLLFFKTHERTKYRSIITCQDTNTLSGVWAGQIIRVGCIQPIWQHTSDTTVRLERHAVSNSIQVVDETGASIPFSLKNNSEPNDAGSSSDSIGDSGDGCDSCDSISNDVYPTICITPNTQPHNGVFYISYRPWLTMHVLEFKSEYDEWGMACAWKLTLEEV